MNKVTLAVAGSRKTQSIVDACTYGPATRRRLALTYTLTGQAELTSRLQAASQPGPQPEVMGWYSFLMRHWVRPFLPLHFPNRRLRGLNFDGEPALGRYTTGDARFLDSDDRAYKRYLSKLAIDVALASRGAVVDRLERIYDEIYVDEVQDLTGCDLLVLAELMKSKIDLFMVGDVRQSVFDTNPQDPHLKKYRGVKMLEWFLEHEKTNSLVIEQSIQTWRSNQAIADFSDSIFPAEFSFAATKSMQSETTGHDGVFAVGAGDLAAYVSEFEPLCLRDSKRTAADVDLPFMNFGLVKGLTVDRVLVFPTRTILDFLIKNTELKPKTACGLYVSVTRARHSVAFVMDDPAKCGLAAWFPRQPSHGDMTRTTNE